MVFYKACKDLILLDKYINFFYVFLLNFRPIESDIFLNTVYIDFVLLNVRFWSLKQVSIFN